MKMRKRVKDLKLTATFKYGAVKTPEGWPNGTHSYKVVLKCGKTRRQFTTEYHMGPGITEDPTVVDVVNCLASDAASFENASGFPDFCQEFGYDDDSIKAKKIYNDCRKASDNLTRLLGNYRDVHGLMFDTERL